MLKGNTEWRGKISTLIVQLYFTNGPVRHVWSFIPTSQLSELILRISHLIQIIEKSIMDKWKKKCYKYVVLYQKDKNGSYKYIFFVYIGCL